MATANGYQLYGSRSTVRREQEIASSPPHYQRVDMRSTVYEHDSSVGLGGLAALASSLKVTCKDTIDFTLDRNA